MLAEDISTQKGSPLSSKGGRAKYKRSKRETKEVGTEIHPGKGVLKKREVSKYQETLSPWWVCGEPWNLSGQNNWEEK